MSHPKEDRIRELYASLGRGDLKGFLAGCTDDIVFTIPGRAAISGTFTRDTVLDMLIIPARLSGGTLTEEILDVIANDAHGILLLVHRLQRDGRHYEYRTAHVVQFAGDKVSAWWEHPGSIAELERAWGQRGGPKGQPGASPE